MTACALFASIVSSSHGEPREEVVPPPPEFAGRDVGRLSASDGDSVLDHSKFLQPEAAEFDEWEPLLDDHEAGVFDHDRLLPFDWMRHWGFRHSSTDGLHTDRGIPLQYTSWLNRPYHIDWFVGPMLADNPNDRVAQTNEVIAGLRVGWDFDYYWGLEWRFAWSDPDIYSSTESDLNVGRYFASDIDVIYYPWGDSKIRPFFQWGLGLAEIDTLRIDDTPQQVTLLTMPLGVGVQFPMTRWLAWRLEIVDNLSFGNDGVDTLNNFMFTAGMEWRLGAKPHSYWPWRTSRTVW